MSMAVADASQSSCSSMVADIRLYAPDYEPHVQSERMLLSRGTLPAESRDSRGAYVAAALIPNPIWRKPSESEQSMISSVDAPNDRRFVAVLRLFGTQQLESFRPSINSLWLMTREDERVFLHPLVVALLGRLKLYAHHTERLQYTGLTFDPPGLETVSIDASRKYVGLHVDYWDRKPLSERHSSPSRLCVNIGTESRHLLYMNVGLERMAVMLREANVEPAEEPAHLARQFMSSFPAYPVIRLLIEPGEAYIAPTEYIIHDASSAEASGRTQHLAFRSDFRIQEIVHR